MKKSQIKSKLFYGGQKNTSFQTIIKPQKPKTGLFSLLFKPKNHNKTQKIINNTITSLFVKQKSTEDVSANINFKYSVRDKKQKKGIFYYDLGDKKSANLKKDNNSTPHDSDYGTKIFEPNPVKLKKELLINSIQTKIKPPKRQKYGLKPVEEIAKSYGRVGIGRIWLNVRSWAAEIRLAGKLNRLIGSIIILGTFLFLIYLIFFDTFFLVKKYEITFTNGSYLDSTNVEQLIKSFNQDPFLGFIPNNQFWFLSDQNLSAVARNSNPEIVQVRIVERIWPNQVKIEITTKPILITLGLNNRQEYWRIGQNGRVVSRDEANLRQNLVVVEKPTTLTFATNSPSDLRFENPNFADYSFEHREQQLNRFWFIIWLWAQLEELGINTVKTSIPSISDFDTDVVITTTNNTKLYFDLKSGDMVNQARRLNFAFKSKIGQQESQGELAYIDFRTPKKIFVCPKNAKCATEKS